MTRRLWLVLLLGCGAPAPPTIIARAVSSPAPDASRLPHVSQLPDGSPLVTWVEARPDSGYTFKLSVWQGEGWSPARVIADNRDIIVFDADLHGVRSLTNGTLVAHWQIRATNTKNPWATVMQVAVSMDTGRTWSKPAVPHSDERPGEHGFVASFPLGDSLGLVWLDERRVHTLPKDSPEGSIGVRFAAIGRNGRPGPDSWVDSVTCECCPNSAAVTASGPVVVFRNRVDSIAKGPTGKPLAVRDIYLARLEGGRWTTPKPVHADNWLFPGCPDNGPAVDARGDTVVVAWWTAPDEKPRVNVAFSTDAGTTFSAPVRVEQDRPEGQVTVMLSSTGAVVGWLEADSARARWVGREGALGRVTVLGPAATHTRLPAWVPFEDGILATWTTQVDEHTRGIRMAAIREPGK